MAGNVVYLCGLFRENAFGAARRACRGKAPPSANADRSAAQKPHWGFHCYAALRKRGRSKREI